MTAPASGAYHSRAIVAAVLDLLDEDPELVCTHLALTPQYIARVLRLAGRAVLAQRFAALYIVRVSPEALVAEVQHFAAEGVPEVCRRLGRRPAAVARALQRAGHPELAIPFDREVRRQRAARRGAEATPRWPGRRMAVAR